MRARAVLPLLIAAFALSGCARAPELGEPVDASLMAELVARLAEGVPAASSFRGMGEAEIAASGRTLKVTFAAVYERPGWLRADLRPALGTMGASLTAQAVVDAGCLSLYFPARLIEVTGCVSDVALDIGTLDAAGLVMGLPDPSLLSRLEGATLHRAGDRITVSGRLGAALVAVRVNEPLAVIEEVRIGTAEEEDALLVAYDGFGWKPGLRVPRECSLVVGRGTSRETEVSIRYNSLRSDEPVDRSTYALQIPPGIPSIDWKDLSIWR